jgi:hypothetical protein
MTDLFTAPLTLANDTTSYSYEEMDAVRTGLLLAVAYGDVFNYPMSVEEIQRYLVDARASTTTVQQLVWEETKQAQRLSQRGELVCLAGREGLFEIRNRRQAIAQERWAAARAYGRILAGLPFVRMVAVTGSLAMDNVEAGGDIDYLVVTAAGRLWLCRAMTILVVRWAAFRGERLCPNYFLSQTSLESKPHTLYNAHELAHMVPLNNPKLYQRMRASNAWTSRYLPNAQSAPTRTLPDRPGRWVQPAQRLGEAWLSGRLGDRLESWEMKRKIERLYQKPADPAEIDFCAEQCKGHFEGHAGRAMAEFASRVKQLGLSTDDWGGHPEERS